MEGNVDKDQWRWAGGPTNKQNTVRHSWAAFEKCFFGHEERRQTKPSCILVKHTQIFLRPLGERNPAQRTAHLHFQRIKRFQYIYFKRDLKTVSSTWNTKKKMKCYVTNMLRYANSWDKKTRVIKPTTVLHTDTREQVRTTSVFYDRPHG